ncbi:MAG: hypothetical protein U0P46_03500 [Holophagaceae bacterium]
MKPTVDELRLIESPTSQVSSIVEALAPKAIEWYESLEKQLLPLGRPLTKKELLIAKRLDVERPEEIRIVVLAEFPMPSDPALLQEAKRLGLDSDQVIGRTNGNVILLKPSASSDESVVAHELVHVRQIRKLGIKAFIRRYVLELEAVGYRRAPLELEAYSTQRKLYPGT